MQNVRGQVQNYLGAVANAEGNVYNQVSALSVCIITCKNGSMANCALAAARSRRIWENGIPALVYFNASCNVPSSCRACRRVAL